VKRALTQKQQERRLDEPLDARPHVPVPGPGLAPGAGAAVRVAMSHVSAV
jgi:hypothetical protein